MVDCGMLPPDICARSFYHVHGVVVAIYAASSASLCLARTLRPPKFGQKLRRLCLFDR